MSAELERLLRLAKKSGDTFIVFDPSSGSHQVILDIERYEALLGAVSAEPNSCADVWSDCAGADEEMCAEHSACCGVDGEGMIGQDVDFLEGLQDEGVRGGVDMTEDWHSAAEVLGSMSPDFEAPQCSEAIGVAYADEKSNNDLNLRFEPQTNIPAPTFGNLDAPEQNAHDPRGQRPDTIENEALEYDPLMQEPAPIPMIERGEIPAEDAFVEEPLEDEPIFFEEPIN